MGIVRVIALLGTLFEIFKASVMDLLLPGDKVQIHDLDRPRIIEVGNGWIVEGQMSVLPDSDARNVQGYGF